MGFVLFFRWWYTAGWTNSFVAVFWRVKMLAAELSMGILLSTLFEPWKQITTYSGPSAALDTKMRVLLDNIFSRVFGFVIRIFVIFIGSILCMAVFVFGVALAVLWPAVPFLPFIYILLAVRG